MTHIARLSAMPLVHVLGWTLLNFIWQGALVALLLACALSILPSRASRARYAVACAAMALMAALSLITLAVLAARMRQEAQSAPAIAMQNFGEVMQAGLSPAVTWPARCEKVLNESLPGVIGFWLAGILVLLCRLNLGLMATKRMRSQAVEPAAEELQRMMRSLRARFGIERTIEILHSARVSAPTVIGWFRPAILIPAGCLMGLSTMQLEALLAHELAHIRRHDYLVNLLQAVITTVLFYHPGVWWVSKKIRCEREHCCDDLAITVSGDRLAYAKALSLLEARRSAMPVAALAATGGVLKMRITRILGMNQPPVFPRAVAVTLLILAGTATGMAAMNATGTTPLPNRQAATRQMTAEQRTNQNQAPARKVRVQVRTLKIVSSDLPESTGAEISHALSGKTYPSGKVLLDLIQQQLRERGYLLARVESADLGRLLVSPPTHPADISAQVAAGAQYRLGAIVVKGDRALTQEEIIRQFPLHSGDLFDATAIAHGLVHLKKLYVAKGYMNFGAIPTPQIDDLHHTVTLNLRIVEGKPTPRG